MPLTISSISRNARILIATLVLYVILLACLALALNDAQFARTFSEAGLFEQGSIAAWVLTAFVASKTAWQGERIKRTSHCAHAILFIMCAMREADWHKKFTADGILKIKYYTRSAADMYEKIPAALISLLFIGLMIHALTRCVRHAKVKSNLLRESTWVMMTGISLFFVGKILDRSISILTETFGLNVAPLLKKIIGAQEEGLEMLGPLFIAIAFLWPSSNAKNPHHQH